MRVASQAVGRSDPAGKDIRAVFAVLVLLGVALILLSMRLIGYEKTWQSVWNIPTIMPPFEDTRVVTGAAQSLKAGYDPTVSNVFDPSHQPFNYPQIWYPLLRTPMDVTWTVPLAVVSIALFFAGVLIFPARLSTRAVPILLLALFSPAVMLGLERANTDILVFMIVSVCLLLAEALPVAALFALLFAVVFKLFPIFAAGLFMDRERRPGIPWIATALAATAVYFVLTLQDMLRVFRTTLKGDNLSYGTTVLARRLVNEYAAGYAFLRFRVLHIPTHVDYPDLRLVAYGAAAVVLLLLLVAGVHSRKYFQDGDPSNLRALRAGAGIYVGTFLLGNNHDYRLVFLLFTIPLLVEWSLSSARRSIPRLALVLLLLSMWYLPISRALEMLIPHGDTYAYLLDQVFKWGLFACLFYLLAASLPMGLSIDRQFDIRAWLKRPEAEKV